MQRIAIAIGLTASIASLALAGLALLESRSRDPIPPPATATEFRELRERVASLDRRLSEITSRLEEKHSFSTGGRASRDVDAAGEPRALEPASSPSGFAAPGTREAVDLALATLAERLDELESAETIHELAQSGRKQAVSRRFGLALERLKDPGSTPEQRLEAMETVRSLRKSNGGELASLLEQDGIGELDLAWPMLELAQDPGVDPGLRGEALHGLAVLRAPELREPLLTIFAHETDEEVRVGAFDALAWHMDDASVRQVLREAAADEQYPALRARATRLLPKLEHVEREAAARVGEAGRESGEADREK